MKSIVRLGMVLGLLASSAFSAEEQIPWARDFQTACELASDQRRLVLLHFYNDNCPPCVRVDQNVFSQPQVAEAVALNYVPVKVHAGKTPQLASRYQVTRWPTDVIVTPAGLEVYRAISPQRPADYIALVNQVALQTGTGAGRQWTADKNPMMQRGGQNAAAAAGQTAAAAPNAASQVAIDAQQSGVPGQSAGVGSSSGASGSPAGTSQPNVPGRRSSFVPGDGGSFRSSSPTSYSTPETTAPPTQASAPAPQQPVAKMQAALPTENPWFTAARSAAPAIGGTEVNPPHAQATGREFVPQAQATVQPQAGIPQPAAVAQRPEEQSYFSATATEAAVIPQAAPSSAFSPAPSVAPASVQAAEVRQMVPADQAPPIALGGHCPVTLVERNTWSKADPLYGAIHEGQTYLFVSATEQQRFLAEPGRYALPPLGLDGFCPVTLRDQMKWQKAEQRHFAIHRGRMYCFASAAEREKFLAAPDAYAPVLSGYDPVRFAQRGELVEGKRAYGLITRDQYRQIFLFGDVQSLEAFEREPTAYQDRVRQAMAQNAGANVHR